MEVIPFSRATSRIVMRLSAMTRLPSMWSLTSSMPLHPRDRFEAAGPVALVAADAQAVVDDVGLGLLAGDGLGRTGPLTYLAAVALLVDGVGEQGLTLVGWALAVGDVRLVLPAEVLEGGEHRVRGGLAQAAQRVVPHQGGQVLQLLEIPLLALALGDADEDLQHPLGAHPAERAFPTGLALGEVQEEAGHIHHARGLVEHHQPARAHDGARLVDGLVVDDGVLELRGDAASGGAAHLHGLELAVLLDTPTDVVDDLPDGDPNRNLHQPAPPDLAGHGEDLGSLTVGRAQAVEGLRPVENDPGHVGEGFHVVDVGGALPRALDRREGRPHPRHAAAALDRGDEGGLLAAHEGPRPLLQLDVELEPGAEYVVTQQAVRLGLRDGDVQPLDGHGVLGAHVDVPTGGADGVAGDGHALQHRVGVALQDRAIHEGSGVALVGVTDHVLLLAWRQPGEAPLHAGEEARPPAPSQPGLDDHVDEAVWVLPVEDPLQGLVPAHLQVLLDLLRVDHPAVAQHDALLAVEEGLFLALAFAGPHQPLLDGLAFPDVLLEQPVDSVRGHLPVLPARPAVLAHLHQRLAVAHAHAAGLPHLAAAVERPRPGQDRGVGRPGARRDPARAQPHEDPHALIPLSSPGKA